MTLSAKDQDMTTISVIVGSTRQGRFSEKPAQWILQHLQERDGIEARLLDLRDFPMPFFDQTVSPAAPGRAPYENEVVKRWTAAIAASGGFVFVTPEYNYGPSAVLKNSPDCVYPEWNRKAAAFVSHARRRGPRMPALTPRAAGSARDVPRDRARAVGPATGLRACSAGQLLAGRAGEIPPDACRHAIVRGGLA